MQLTTIALATILISSLATGSKDISPSLKARMAAFQVPEEVQPGPGVRGQPPTGSKKTTISAPEYTPSSKSSVRTFPSSVERGKGFAKPTPTREPTATSSHPKPVPAPKTPVAPTSAKPVASKSAAGPPKPAPVLSSQPKPSERFGGTQEPQGSNVAELRKKFGSSPSSTSASASRSAPRLPVKTHSSSATTAEVPERPTVQANEPITEQSTYPTIILGPGTPPVTPEEARLLITRKPTSPHSASEALPKVSGVSPKTDSIPEDADLIKFKQAIEQGNYSGAMKIVKKLPEEKSLKPYARYLANFTTSEILAMTETYEAREHPIGADQQGKIITTLIPSDHIHVTLGLFLMCASDDKFTDLLERLEPEIKDEALFFSMMHGVKLSPKRLVKIFREFAKEKQADVLEVTAVIFLKFGKSRLFEELVGKLQDERVLDKDLVNYAFNAAFLGACLINNFGLVLEYYRQAKILSSVYVKAMEMSYEYVQRDIFDWLLDNAGGDDLNTFILKNRKIVIDGGMTIGYSIPEEVLDNIKERYKEIRYRLRKE